MSERVVIGFIFCLLFLSSCLLFSSGMASSVLESGCFFAVDWFGWSWCCSVSYGSVFRVGDPVVIPPAVGQLSFRR